MQSVPRCRFGIASGSSIDIRRGCCYFQEVTTILQASASQERLFNECLIFLCFGPCVYSEWGKCTVDVLISPPV